MTDIECNRRIRETKASIANLERLEKLNQQLDAMRLRRVSKNAGATMEHAVQIVCEHYQIERQLVFSKSRVDEITKPRQVMFYLIRKYAPDIPYAVVGAYFRRDHGTIIYGVRKVKNFMELYASFRTKVEACEALFKIKLTTMEET